MRREHEAYWAQTQGYKVPRKLKLFTIGRKVSKKKKRQMIDSFLKNPEAVNPCCHNCGHNETYLVDHGVEYPEIYQDDKCLRCHTIVSYRDNSKTQFTILEER